ncbi:MAG: hypothetical protein AAGB93_18240 [Planctomycetota bacterium]
MQSSTGSPSRLFVITGCARSGLGFTAQILTGLGAPCGHEVVFNTPTFEVGGTVLWPPTLAGEASWLAAPVLGKLPAGTVVLHQVRHPLATIHGLYASGFFERVTSHRAFVNDFLPETKLGGPLVRCMRFWLEWNRMIDAASDYDDLVHRRVRVEDFEGSTVCETTALLGLARNLSTVEGVLRGVSGHGRAADRHDMTWERLPPGRLRDDVVEAAERYGYTDVPVRRAAGA